jgi:hypothetical protein
MKENFKKMIIEEEATKIEVEIDEIETDDDIRKKDFIIVILIVAIIFAGIVASHITHLIIGH